MMYIAAVVDELSRFRDIINLPFREPSITARIVRLPEYIRLVMTFSPLREIRALGVTRSFLKSFAKDVKQQSSFLP